MQYANIIDMGNIFHSAIKCNNLEILGYVQLKLSSIFLMTSQINDGKYLVLYSLELTNSEILKYMNYESGDVAMAVNRWTVTKSMKSELVNSYWKYMLFQNPKRGIKKYKIQGKQ